MLKYLEQYLEYLQNESNEETNYLEIELKGNLLSLSEKKILNLNKLKSNPKILSDCLKIASNIQLNSWQNTIFTNYSFTGDINLFVETNDGIQNQVIKIPEVTTFLLTLKVPHFANEEIVNIKQNHTEEYIQAISKLDKYIISCEIKLFPDLYFEKQDFLDDKLSNIGLQKQKQLIQEEKELGKLQFIGLENRYFYNRMAKQNCELLQDDLDQIQNTFGLVLKSITKSVDKYYLTNFPKS